MGCPSEIRNTIYSYVLTFEHHLIRKKASTDENRLALLQTSRAVEREAAPLFYELNTFHFICQDLDTPEDNHDASQSTLYDVQAAFRYVDIPDRHVNSLRNLSIAKVLPGIWPNKIIIKHTSRARVRSLGTLQLEKLLLWLASRNMILKILSIDFSRLGPVSSIDWDEDPSLLLGELDSQRRISNAILNLRCLKSLHLWKSRIALRRNMNGWDSGEKGDWKPIQPEAFDRVRQHHFSRASEVLYSRKREHKPGDNPYWCYSEGFLINLL